MANPAICFAFADLICEFAGARVQRPARLPLMSFMKCLHLMTSMLLSVRSSLSKAAMRRCVSRMHSAARATTINQVSKPLINQIKQATDHANQTISRSKSLQSKKTQKNKHREKQANEQTLNETMTAPTCSCSCPGRSMGREWREGR